ncbi:hypothetical protein ACPEEZ_14935 [Frigoribacterium sp. 2-23]|uniref:hypothetical protein n=1 Tax=Frigoribacterium sp. 2-23 TaxID=3415006 RepID=UPI003C6F41EE
MTDEHSTDRDADVDGVTTERLSDYLDSGREPYDPEIEESAENLAQLEALARLRRLSGQMMANDASDVGVADATWISNVMSRVRLESRSGRDIPLSSADLRTTLHITEGAVRGLIREAGDRVPGVLVLSCSLDGDLALPDAPVSVEVQISVLFGAAAAELADDVRRAVSRHLLTQTELVVERVDVLVGDIHLLEAERGGAA